MWFVFTTTSKHLNLSIFFIYGESLVIMSLNSKSHFETILILHWLVYWKDGQGYFLAQLYYSIDNRFWCIISICSEQEYGFCFRIGMASLCSSIHVRSCLHLETWQACKGRCFLYQIFHAEKGRRKSYWYTRISYSFLLGDHQDFNSFCDGIFQYDGIQCWPRWTSI